MNIVVCIKQTFNTEAKIALNGSGQIEDKGVNLIINPYDMTNMRLKRALSSRKNSVGQ